MHNKNLKRQWEMLASAFSSLERYVYSRNVTYFTVETSTSNSTSPRGSGSCIAQIVAWHVSFDRVCTETRRLV
jgi:hypothetical protein